MSRSAPEIQGNESESVSTQLGGSLELSCVATGDPEPVVAWVREADSWHIPSTTSSGSAETLAMVEGSHSMLELKRVRASDAGAYTCIATSAAGVAQKRFFVDVSVPAAIVKPSDGVEPSVALGESIALECRVSGSPLPVVRWLKDGMPISARDHRGARYTFLAGE
ncbi:protein amalgam-like [Haemaphysalis longicornis]